MPRFLLLAALALAALATASPAAAADRSPTKAERRAIERKALKACGAAAPAPCTFHRARVSTRNPRFAWADVTGEGFSAVLLKRRTDGARRFRVAGTQGGGIGECSYWLARAPARVLRDLHVSGLVEATGEVRNCGRV